GDRGATRHPRPNRPHAMRVRTSVKASRRHRETAPAPGRPPCSEEGALGMNVRMTLPLFDHAGAVRLRNQTAASAPTADGTDGGARLTVIHERSRVVEHLGSNAAWRL